MERKEAYDKDDQRLAELRCFKRLITEIQELIGPTYSKYAKYNLGIRCRVKGHGYIEPDNTSSETVKEQDKDAPKNLVTNLLKTPQPQ